MRYHRALSSKKLKFNDFKNKINKKLRIYNYFRFEIYNIIS